MIGKLQLIFIVRDKNARRKLGVAHITKYIGAMVKLLQWRQLGSVNPEYGIVEVESWLITIERNSQFLTRERIYSLANIIKKPHIILATLLSVSNWFVNNYID